MSNLTSAIGDLANRGFLASYISRHRAMAYDSVCQHIIIIMAITVIVIIKVALAFERIQWHNNVDHCMGCHVGRLLLCDKDDANQR